MDGFVSAQPNAGVGSVAMGYFNGGDLPYYSSLASKFTLFDHFYAQTQAGSLPNRLVSVAATSDGITSNATPTFGINGVSNYLRPPGPGPCELEVLRAGLPIVSEADGR